MYKKPKIRQKTILYKYKYEHEYDFMNVVSPFPIHRFAWYIKAHFLNFISCLVSQYVIYSITSKLDGTNHMLDESKQCNIMGNKTAQLYWQHTTKIPICLVFYASTLYIYMFYNEFFLLTNKQCQIILYLNGALSF